MGLTTRKRRRLNLGTKFIMLTSSLVLVTSFVIGLYVIRSEQRDNYELLLDHGRSLIRMIAQNSERAMSSGDSHSLRRIVDLISGDPSIAYIFILDPEERVVMYQTAENHPIHIPHIHYPPHFRDSNQILHQSYFNKEDGKQYVNILAPVLSADRSGLRENAAAGPRRLAGYIDLGVSQEGVNKRIRSFLSSILLFTTLIIVPGIAATVLITRRIIAPINELNRAATETAEGKLDRHINIRTNDEVSDLARAFNHMLERLQISDQEVKRHTAELIVALERAKREMAEREKTERALKESETKYRTIFEESRDVIFICAPDGVFLDINHAGAELFGYPSAQALGAVDPVRELYEDPEDYAVLTRMLERQGFVNDHEVRMKRSSGEKLTVLVTAVTVRDDRGAITSYRGVFHDVTETRRLEQQLLQSQKMEAIGRLAGGIAHDFNNILTAIMGYANLLLMDMPADSPLQSHAEHILTSSERAANLTRSLLAFSRKQVISPKPVDLNRIVDGIEELLIRLIGEDIELKKIVETREATVLADGGQIEQVLINLCTNARDAMPRGGTLTITVSTVIVQKQSVYDRVVDKPGAYATISVADTGIGIDEKIREKVFEPFFTTKETGKGTGLGLSIVYGIMKQHNGFVTLSSEPDKGSVFRLYLPLIGSAAESDYGKASVRPRGGTETILVAEDDPEVRKLIRIVLSGNGYRVLEAIDGQDALAVLSGQNGKVHLLILDIIMPKKNGREVYETVRNSDPGLKAIFMSGYTADIIDKQGMPPENRNFLSKPIAPLELLELVRTVLDR